MYCTNCGKQIQMNRKKCPFCGQPVEQEENHTPKMKKWKIILFLFILLILMMVVLCIFLKHRSTKISVSQEEIISQTKRYDNGDTVFTSSLDHVTFDENESIVYVDNLLLVYLNDALDQKKKEYLADSVDGIVVGELEGSINSMQIMTSDSNLEQLMEKAKKLMTYDEVSYATYTCPIVIEDDSLLWNGDNDIGNQENPSGADWWAEAIEGYTAWNLSDSVSPITVGILDSGFETEHEDLKDKSNNSIITMLNENSINEDNPEHGTHVTGLVAAQNNSYGIRGIADCSDIICMDWKMQSNDSLLYPESVLVMFQQMIEYAETQNSPIVINNSWGVSLGWIDWFFEGRKKFQYSYNEKSYNEKATLYLSIMALKMIEQLINNSKTEFIIVQSAGNGYDNMMKGYDASLSGWFSGITKSLCKTYSRYDYKDIKKHIVVVGAVNNSMKDGKYELCNFSNYGSTIDICAPGKNIYSTILNNEYGFRDGTSMAAPIVSGSIALIWSLNPKLTAAEVKDCLIHYTNKAIGVTDKDKGKIYPMLSIGKAVKSLVKEEPEPDENTQIPRDASDFNGHEYKIYNFESIDSWMDAEKYCKSLGGHLATIESKEENDFLYQLMVKNNYSCAYFGLTDLYEEGDWKWIDGSLSGFTNWHSGEPNDENPDEDYGEFYFKYTDGTWNDGDFGNNTVSDEKNFICEWENGKAYEPEISHQYMDFQQNDAGEFIGFTYDF